MDTMNIVDYKSQLDSLTGDLLNEYIKLETMYLREKNKTTNELMDMNKLNSSFTSTLQSKIDEVSALEKEVQGYKSREQAYLNTIENQRIQLDELSKGGVEETTENKFDMVRSQAKEITCKDKEIIRLTKEITRLKEVNNMKQCLSMVIEDTSEEATDKPAKDKPAKDKPAKDITSELDASDKEDDSGGGEEEDDGGAGGEEEGGDSEDDEDELFEVISYRKKKYYKDNKDRVYAILDDEDVGDYIGEWVKQDNGRSKLVKP